jgi:YVTN family beta-propeller protein
MTFKRFQGSLLAAAVVCTSPALHSQDVRATIPNGREIRPVGHWTRLAPYPFAISVRPDGREAAIPSIGFPFAINVVTNPESSEASVRELADEERRTHKVETHAGLAYSPDGSLLYVATGDSGKVAVYTTSNWNKATEIPLDGPLAGKAFTGSFAANVILSPSGRWLYALDQGNWRIVIIDTQTRERVATIATGAYPFGLALSPDATRLYVTNTGLFEYTALPGIKSGATKAQSTASGLHFPPSGYPSKAARNGAKVEGIAVPGLGDENSTRGSSLWTYTLEDGKPTAIAAKLRLGARITEARNAPIGGAAPTGVVASQDAVYVALTRQDSVVKISPDGAHLLDELPLNPLPFRDRQGNTLRGVMPSGLALGGGRLYVAESGINAVAVLDTATMQVLEHIPAGWNPSAVALSPNGQTLFIVNAKGQGTGPNGGKQHDPSQKSYIGSLEYGSLTAVDLSTITSGLTATVIAANTAAIAHQPTLPHLKHCFLVIRENRTFDEVLGDLAGANGDPTLARYGLTGWAEEAPKNQPPISVTPNLHAIAQQFATSDNFFVDSDVSADGHRWVLGINPTPFFNTAWTSNYGGRRTSSPTPPPPGRRALFGGADAPMPEDEPQFGSLWEHVANSGKGILNYGEGLELEGSDEADGLAPEGQRLLLNSPLPKPVFESSDRRFPTFNLGIPDQNRAAEFEADLRRRIALGKVPALIVIRLPNDHTANIRPADGYPYRASYVADNDLALGKIVAFLSATPLWKDSALFVTEDDAQGGVDHIDAHRSILAIASPWTIPGAIAHTHSSMGSITRTIDELLGLGPLNLEDALAGELTGVFDTTPHLAPFVLRPSDPHVFDPAKARIARPRSKVEAAALRDMDDPDDIRPQVERTARKRRKDSDD